MRLKLTLIGVDPVKVLLLEKGEVAGIVGGEAVAGAAARGDGSSGREDNFGRGVAGDGLSDGALYGVGDDGAGEGTENREDGLGEHDGRGR